MRKLTQKVMTWPQKTIVSLFILVFAIVGSHFLISSHAASLTGDLNADNTVNVFDLSILLTHWQQTGTGVIGDLNSDSIVNIFDLSILLTNYGTTGSGQTGSVPCALTHSAGADGTNSCWAMHTGVTGSTGYTEAQIMANPAAAGFAKIDGPVTINSTGCTPVSACGSNLVVDHKWINGCIAINAGANNATIKNTLITSNGATCQSQGDQATAGGALNAGQDNGSTSAPTGTLLEDITVDGGTGEADYGITLPHGECLHCNVFHFDQNIWGASGTAANPILFEGDYVHDIMLPQPWETPTSCGHRNGFMLDTASYVTVDDSYAIMTGSPCVTGAISLQADWGPPDHITVRNSYGEGVEGMDFNGGCATNTTITNNAFSNQNGYGGTDFSDYANSAGITWTNNYVPETGVQLDPGGGC